MNAQISSDSALILSARGALDDAGAMLPKWKSAKKALRSIWDLSANKVWALIKKAQREKKYKHIV